MIDEEGRLRRIDYGDKIYFDDVLGIAGTAYPIGTAFMPSDVIADIITICVARNLHQIQVHGNLTLGDDMEHYCFFGYEHQEITDQIALAGQDVDGSHIEGLIVTGQQGGTAFLTLVRCTVNALTLFAGRMHYCSFYTSTSSFRNASFIDLVDCESISGAVTITVQAPSRASIKNWRGNLILTAQNGGLCHVRGFKGYLEIDLMTAGTLNIYATGAEIQINNDCSGGTINIYGNARVTDNSAAGCTVHDYTEETQLDGKPNVQEVIIYPVAEDAGTTELADDGADPEYYPAAAHSTDSNAEGAPGVAWTEDIDFEQESTINIISIYAEFEWQTELVVGGGDAANSISKIQISRDGGANWVDLTDNFSNAVAAMTNRVRAGVGLWIPTIVAGANQLQFRLVHWTDDSVGGGGRSTSQAKIRSNSFVRITYRKG